MWYVDTGAGLKAAELLGESCELCGRFECDFWARRCVGEGKLSETGRRMIAVGADIPAVTRYRPWLTTGNLDRAERLGLGSLRARGFGSRT